MELLSPAGNFEKLKAAVTFGADAVYFGGNSFGLRASAGNFDFDTMAEAIKYLHDRGKKGYLTVNVFANTSELDDIEKYLKTVSDIGVDGIIVSDPGIFYTAKKSGIKTPISISTQANTTNLAAVNFWADLGANRVIMAREVTAKDLESTIAKANCEVEVFIHGAICISMSGRCLISSYMTGRNANKGECTHPCRWNYSLVEETRPGEYYPVYEDEKGSYLYNSKDLMLLDKIGELERIGVKSGKIEGRMKSVMYVSVVTGVYRAAIDRAMKDPENYKSEESWKMLLHSISNRGYTEGFFGGDSDSNSMNRDTGGYKRGADFLGVIEKSIDNEIFISARAKFTAGEKISILDPNLNKIDITPDIIYDENYSPVENTRPNYKYRIKFDKKIDTGALLMRF